MERGARPRRQRRRLRAPAAERDRPVRAQREVPVPRLQPRRSPGLDRHARELADRGHGLQPERLRRPHQLRAAAQADQPAGDDLQRARQLDRGRRRQRRRPGRHGRSRGRTLRGLPARGQEVRHAHADRRRRGRRQDVHLSADVEPDGVHGDERGALRAPAAPGQRRLVGGEQRDGGQRRRPDTVALLHLRRRDRGHPARLRRLQRAHHQVAAPRQQRRHRAAHLRQLAPAQRRSLRRHPHQRHGDRDRARRLVRASVGASADAEPGLQQRLRHLLRLSGVDHHHGVGPRRQRRAGADLQRDAGRHRRRQRRQHHVGDAGQGLGRAHQPVDDVHLRCDQLAHESADGADAGLDPRRGRARRAA